VHRKAIEVELAKNNKPRDSVLIPLMKSTFAERRSYILEDSVSVEDILQWHRKIFHLRVPYHKHNKDKYVKKMVLELTKAIWLGLGVCYSRKFFKLACLECL